MQSFSRKATSEKSICTPEPATLPAEPRTWLGELAFKGGSVCALLGALTGISGCGAPTAPGPQPWTAPGQGSNLPQALPSNFEMKEKFFSVGTGMSIVSGGVEHGYVDERVLSWGRSFEYYNGSGTKVASAKEKVFSWGVKIEIFDGAGQPIGTIKEEILKNLVSWMTHYQILDAAGELVAESEKIDFFSTNIEIRDVNGELEATMSRPAFNLTTDKWTISMSGDVDPRLIIFIPAYKTSSDNQE